MKPLVYQAIAELFKSGWDMRDIPKAVRCTYEDVEEAIRMALRRKR